MRALLLVLDSVGAGAMPDAADWGDAGTDTLGHTAEAVGGLHLPHLQELGLGNLHPVRGVPPVERPRASWGRMAIRSRGKDTLTGHWELAGCLVTEPFAYFPEGFPPDIIAPFERAIGRRVLGNRAASGTVIIQELGDEHVRTGRPIVYTSADSVFQVAAHEEVVPPEQLYAWCEEAFRIVAPRRVARVIARPFRGETGHYYRTDGRRDYALQPPCRTLMDRMQERGLPTTAVGKVKNIYGGRGFDRSFHAGNNADITRAALEALDSQDEGLVFVNLVDFDMRYGHRRDPEGYARALEAFDRDLPDFLRRLGPDDLFLITADHGNDPTHTGTDHTREHVPVLAWRGGRPGRPLGERAQLADAGATLAEFFGLGPLDIGTSFLSLCP